MKLIVLHFSHFFFHFLVSFNLHELCCLVIFLKSRRSCLTIAYLFVFLPLYNFSTHSTDALVFLYALYWNQIRVLQFLRAFFNRSICLQNKNIVKILNFKTFKFYSRFPANVNDLLIKQSAGYFFCKTLSVERSENVSLSFNWSNTVHAFFQTDNIYNE